MTYTVTQVAESSRLIDKPWEIFKRTNGQTTQYIGYVGARDSHGFGSEDMFVGPFKFVLRLVGG